MAFLAAAPVLAGLGMAGAGISAIGTIAGGIANRNAANYQAAIANNNKIIAIQNAARAEQAGNVQAEATSRKGAAQVAAIKVGQAASGVNVNTGSPVDVQAGQRETNQLDTETVLNNNMLHAYGYRTQATNFEAEENLDKAKADAAVPAAALSATGSLLSNASSTGFKWNGGGGGGGGGSSGVDNYNSGNPIY